MFHHSQYAETTSEKPAYIIAESGQVVTWLEHSRRVNRLAQYFKDIGLKEKDHVAVLMENNPYYFEVINAAIDMGLIYTCISNKLKESETEYVLDNCEALLFVTSFLCKDLASQILSRTPRIKHRLMVGGTIEGYESYEDTVNRYLDDPISYGNLGYAMLYSSGTTGRPKGVLTSTEDCPVGELRSIDRALANLFNINADTVYLSPAPLYHAAPLSYCRFVLNMGGTVILMEKFDAEKSLALIKKYKVTHSQWVPTMFVRMLKLPQETRAKYDMSSMKVAIHAAAPIPVPVKEGMIHWWGPILFEYYGSSEGHTVTMIDSNEWMTRKGTVGKCQIGKMHILDDDGNDLQPYEPGAIYVENGNLFEYYKEPEKTADSRNEKGWATVGDIGYLDEDGYLFLTDRKSNMIISGGVNIYPQEVENYLAVHPKVLDVAVIGVPNEEFGEEVKAVVQLSNQDDASPGLGQELIKYCRNGLSHVKCPKTVDFVKELPRTPTGKLLKRLLKEQY